jgi:hypothetical protein
MDANDLETLHVLTPYMKGYHDGEYPEAMFAARFCEDIGGPVVGDHGTDWGQGLCRRFRVRLD